MNFTLFTTKSVNIIFDILNLAIFARVMFSLTRFQIPNGIKNLINEITDPILDIAKKITPKIGFLDFSPIVAWIGLSLLQGLILNIISNNPF